MNERIIAEAKVPAEGQLIQLANDDNGWRWYENSISKTRYISVTTPLECVQPQKLTDWYKKSTESNINKKLETSRERGNRLHSMVESWAKGIDVGFDPTPEEQEEFKKFIEFAVRHELSPEKSEYRVRSLVLGVAGTVDLITHFKSCDNKECCITRVEGRVVADLKTGRTYSVKAGWQMAGYRTALSEMGWDTVGMVGIQLYGNVKPFVYSHYEFCLQRYVSALESWKGLYYSKLSKLNWPWLHEYSPCLLFEEKVPEYSEDVLH